MKLLWEKQFKEKICVRVGPWKECATAELEVKIFQDGTKFPIEIRLGSLGTLKETLKIGCYKYQQGPLSCEVCIIGLDISNGRLESLRITAELCIGIEILDMDIRECWDVLDSTVKPFTKDQLKDLDAPSELEDKLLKQVESLGIDEAYIEIETRLIK